MTDDINTENAERIDPERLLDHGDVEFTEKPSEVHGHHFDLYEPIEGMAIVGATNDEGEVLLLVDREAGHAVLPYGKVEPGADWATVARCSTEELTGVAVELDGAELVRRKRYRPEDGDRETTGHDVVFRASSAKAAEPVADVGTCEDNHWEAAWVSELPEEIDVHGDVLADIRLFIE